MDEILDGDLNPKPNHERVISYGKFWSRLWAVILDGLIVGVPIVIISSISIFGSEASILLLIIVRLLGLAYRPWMEYEYGATLGKMALGLKVVDLNYDRPSVEAVLLRNIFSLGSGLWSLIPSIIMFMPSKFQALTEFMNYASFRWIFFAVTLVEIVFLLADDRCRALHDRIAHTYVIEGK